MLRRNKQNIQENHVSLADGGGNALRANGLVITAKLRKEEDLAPGRDDKEETEYRDIQEVV